MGADGSVHLHDCALLSGQRAWLAKDGGRDGCLADVVDKGGLSDRPHLGVRKPASLASSSESAAVRRQCACSAGGRGPVRFIKLPSLLKNTVKSWCAYFYGAGLLGGGALSALSTLTVRHSGCIGGICHGLQLVEHGLQFSTISRDHLLLFTGGLDDDRHFIAVAGDQRLAALELGDTADLSPGEFQDILDILSLVRLQVQDNLCLRVIENGSSVAAIPPARRNRTGPVWPQQRLRHSRG